MLSSKKSEMDFAHSNVTNDQSASSLASSYLNELVEIRKSMADLYKKLTRLDIAINGNYPVDEPNDDDKKEDAPNGFFEEVQVQTIRISDDLFRAQKLISGMVDAFGV